MLHFNNHDTYSSFIGGIFSLALILILITISIYKSVELFSQENFILTENAKEFYVYKMPNNYYFTTIVDENDTLAEFNATLYYCKSNQCKFLSLGEALSKTYDES